MKSEEFLFHRFSGLRPSFLSEETTLFNALVSCVCNESLSRGILLSSAALESNCRILSGDALRFNVNNASTLSYCSLSNMQSKSMCVAHFAFRLTLADSTPSGAVDTPAQSFVCPKVDRLHQAVDF